MDEWFEYLYVIGVLNDDDSIGNPMIKELYYTYKNKFPNNPISEDFFFNNTQEEQIRLLIDAINNNEPIRNKRR